MTANRALIVGRTLRIALGMLSKTLIANLSLLLNIRLNRLTGKARSKCLLSISKMLMLTCLKKVRSSKLQKIRMKMMTGLVIGPRVTSKKVAWINKCPR